MDWPLGAPATPWIVTGEGTVAPALGWQMVTFPAIGEQLEPLKTLTVAVADLVVSAWLVALA
jgi:hypothetical protein